MTEIKMPDAEVVTNNTKWAWCLRHWVRTYHVLKDGVWVCQECEREREITVATNS